MNPKHWFGLVLVFGAAALSLHAAALSVSAAVGGTGLSAITTALLTTAITAAHRGIRLLES